MAEVTLLDIKGPRSLSALNAFHQLLLGLKMLPDYLTEGYEDFYQRVDAMPDEDKRAFIAEAILLVPLEEEQVYHLIQFCTDKNGVPYGKHNAKNLKPNELHALMLEVCMEMSTYKIDFLSKIEKKKLPPSQLISEESSQNSPS